MSDQNNVRDHTFDGIEEYDNNLPNWWVWSFVLSILWGGAYGVCYHVLEIEPLGAPRLEQEMLRIEEAKAAVAPSALTGEELIALSHDSERIQAGSELFVSVGCVACHGPEAYGVIGPNLRDDFWYYGSAVDNIIETIHDGRTSDRGIMPAQKIALGKIQSLAAYVINLNRETIKEDHKTATGLPPAGDLDPIEY